MAKKLEQIGVKSFEDIGTDTEVPHIGAKLPERGKPMRIEAASELSFGQKWKKYFFSRGDEGRWTKPDRYEKFLNYTQWPAKTALQALGSVINRANKFVTEVSPFPETMRTAATLNPNALKDILPSMWEARRAFYPIPGSADELKTFGDAMAEDWYEPLAGEPPPSWYRPAMDIAFETLLISGKAAQIASQANKATFTNARLTATEINAAKRIYSKAAIAKMQPSQVRAMLAKESSIIALSKAEKAQLLKRGYKPIQIQNMTPLEAFQLMDDVPMVQSAANVTFKSPFWRLKSYDYKNVKYYPIKSEASKVNAAIDEEGIGWLTNLETIPTMRRKGEATKIVNSAIKFLRSKGVSKVHTIPENKASKNLFTKLGFKQVGREFTKNISAITAKDIPTEKVTNLASATKQAVDRLTASLKRAKRLHPKKERMISLEKSRRVAIAQKIRSSQTGEKAVLASRGPLKGEYPVPAFTTPEINPTDKYYLFESLRTSKMPYFRYQNTGTALLKTLSGEMPTRGEVALLQKHFGSGLAKAILQKRAFGTKAWQNTLDILNMPRATLASWDLSFPLRQGVMLLPGHPKQWAKSFGQMMKAARPGEKGKKYARYLEDMAESSRYAGLRRRAKLDITQWGLSDVTAREEPFLSSWAEMIPGVKWSERTFTTMSNQLRINVFDDIARNWERAGMSWDANPEEFTRLAAFLNHATGRGTIPKRYAGITPHLNAFFFSPRYQISRPQVVYDAFVSLKNPAARKVITGDLVKFVGTGATSMFLLNQIDGVEVELDPRSNEFGKVKVGNTRYDFWAGYAQIARLVAQTASGQALPKGGELRDINKKEVIERYIRTKLSPPAGLAWDILEGETFLGEQMVLEPTFLATDIPKRVAPMVMQDIVDAIRFQGMDGLLPVTSTTAFFGMGVGTWEPSKWELLSREQDDLANSTYGMEWDKLNDVQQKLLKRDNKLLENLEREAAYERTVFPFLEEIKKEQLEAGFDVEAGLSKETQKEMERLKVRVGILPRTWGSWTLNDERYDKYKATIVEELKKILPPALKAEEWGKKSNDIQIQFIEKAIQNAKARARTTIRIGARKTKQPIKTFEQIK